MYTTNFRNANNQISDHFSLPSNSSSDSDTNLDLECPWTNVNPLSRTTRLAIVNNSSRRTRSVGSRRQSWAAASLIICSWELSVFVLRFLMSRPYIREWSRISCWRSGSSFSQSIITSIGGSFSSTTRFSAPPLPPLELLRRFRPELAAGDEVLGGGVRLTWGDEVHLSIQDPGLIRSGEWPRLLFHSTKAFCSRRVCSGFVDMPTNPMISLNSSSLASQNCCTSSPPCSRKLG